jgi:hypothetical protein
VKGRNIEALHPITKKEIEDAKIKNQEFMRKIKIMTPIANANQQNLQKVVICDPITDRCARVGLASKPDSDPVDVLFDS